MAFVSARCPTCKTIQPHRTVGMTRDEKGRKMQSMRCSACGTVQQVYTGEHGENFQENLSAEDEQDAGEGAGQ